MYVKEHSIAPSANMINELLFGLPSSELPVEFEDEDTLIWPKL